MSLLRIACPAVTVSPETSVYDAAEIMSASDVGAVVVATDGIPLGIFTARDLVRRAFRTRVALEVTPITEVMTSAPQLVRADLPRREALALMLSNQIRHLPIVDGDARVVGMVSTRHLLGDLMEDLAQEVESVNAYFCADGIGG